MLYREDLASQGVLYPLTGIDGTAHQNLVTLWTDEFSAEDESVYSELLEEFEGSEQHVMLISSEKFCFANGEFVRSISKVLKDYEVKVIVYVRSQVAQIQSTFLLWLRLGYAYGGSFEAFFDVHLRSFDYNRIVSPWAVFFGDDAIIARAYDHPRIKSDAFSGVEDAIGVKLSNSSLQVSNGSLIPDVSNMLCVLDQTSPDPVFREAVVEALLKVSSEYKKRSSSSLMSVEQIQRVKDYYMIPNFEFARKFLPKEDAAFFLSKA